MAVMVYFDSPVNCERHGGSILPLFNQNPFFPLLIYWPICHIQALDCGCVFAAFFLSFFFLFASEKENCVIVAVCAITETCKKLGWKLVAPSVLDGVNGLCNLSKQVLGSRRGSLGDIISQGSSITKEWLWILKSGVFFSPKCLFFCLSEEPALLR